MDLDTLQGLILLTAVASGHRPLVQQILNDETQSGKVNKDQDIHSESEFENIQDLANGVATLWLRENESRNLWDSDIRKELNSHFFSCYNVNLVSYHFWFYSLLKAPAALLRSSWINTFVRAGLNFEKSGYRESSMEATILASAWAGDVAVFAALLRASNAENISIYKSSKQWVIISSTLIHAAARRGNLMIAKMLIDHRADVNARLDYGDTALLKHGADANRIGGNGNTALHHAVRWGQSMVQVLLDHGAKIEGKGLYRRTTLHHASEEGQKIILKTLLDHGANVNAKDVFGLTPLSIAVEARNEPVVRLLLDYGTNSIVPCRNYYTADGESTRPLVLERAQVMAKEAQEPGEKQNAENIVRLLIDHGACVTDETVSSKTQRGKRTRPEGSKQSEASKRSEKGIILKG
ncbi:hypothetical protein MMC18_004626 [Xylographa bjoerkii]|nr:hypothetical protein [Xylographa bjoerkii]